MTGTFGVPQLFQRRGCITFPRPVSYPVNVSLIGQKRLVQRSYDIYPGSRAIDPKLREVASRVEVIMTSKNFWIRLALNVAIVGGLVSAFGIPSLADGDHQAECQRRLESD